MATPADRLVTEAALTESWPTGTGSPEGTIFAPPGTIYTDTTSTVPMNRVQYIKLSAANTSTGWDVLRGKITRNITSLCTNIGSGSVHLVISDGWNGLKFSSVQTAGGTVELLPASGVLAPYVGSGDERFTLPNMQLALPSRVAQVQASGRVTLLAATDKDLLNGIAWWPRTKALPSTLIGV